MASANVKSAYFGVAAFGVFVVSGLGPSQFRLPAMLISAALAILAYSFRPRSVEAENQIDHGRIPIFRRAARIVPIWASVFLIFMAILIDSPALFYMATAMVATIAACRLQAWLSVRALRFERIAPPAVHVGERVTIMLTVWSERRIQRPLIQITDQLPARMRAIDRTTSLPVAPSLDQPIATRYSFRPMRRGRYRWQWISVTGTDALGLVSMTRAYRTEPAELTVYPARIPVNISLRPVGGEGGTIESEHGRARGSGLEPAGIREYVRGDPIKTIHWRTTARTGQIMVKEFEVGSAVRASFYIQRRSGTEVGDPLSTLEAMCGHAVFLAEQLIRGGASVTFPASENETRPCQNEAARMSEILTVLTGLEANLDVSLGEELANKSVHGESSVYLFLAVQESDLLGALARIPGEKVCLIYDAAAYGKLSANQLSAADPSYLDRLRQVGAQVHLMPHVKELG